MRQEGEMALAAKRRRLSQADGGGAMATGGHRCVCVCVCVCVSE